MRFALTPCFGFRCLLPFAILLSLSRAALAQEGPIDTERFKPAVTHDGWVTAEGSAVRPTADPLELWAFLNYGINPLIVAQDGNLEAQFVGGHLGLDLGASLTLARPFAVGIGLPLYAVQTGDGDPSFAGLGDVRLVPKFQILDDREGIGLAAALELRAPTHTGDFNGGARNVQAVPKVIVDHRFVGGLHLGANAGVAIRESTRFFNVYAGSEFTYAVALGYRFGGIEGDTELAAELAGGVGLSEQDPEEVPLEALPHVTHRFDPEWQVIGGVGIGVLAGYGVPIFRPFVGVRYAPTDHDGDGDGIPDDEDQCPAVREDRDGIQDTDGCPEEDPDSDKDGVPDHEDQCPTAKETINGHDDADGCPDSGDPRVIYEDNKFVILDAVHFEHGSSQIKSESHSLLDQVALTMKANPEVKKIRVEGHTDDTGAADVNLRLSRERAGAVRRYLVEKGVDARRLSAEGYGEDRPLEKDTTEAARAKNRRVEFIVE